MQAEANPVTVALAKKLARYPVNGRRRALRDVAGERRDRWAFGERRDAAVLRFIAALDWAGPLGREGQKPALSRALVPRAHARGPDVFSSEAIHAWIPERSATA